MSEEKRKTIVQYQRHTLLPNFEHSKNKSETPRSQIKKKYFFLPGRKRKRKTKNRKFQRQTMPIFALKTIYKRILHLHYPCRCLLLQCLPLLCWHCNCCFRLNHRNNKTKRCEFIIKITKINLISINFYKITLEYSVS